MLNKFIDINEISPSNEEFAHLEKKTKEISGKIKEGIKKLKLKADLFLGGSYAKKTLMRKDKYDVDVYVRFNKEHGKISDLLERILKKTKMNYKRIHGSRDYFQIVHEGTLFEIIPVKKIKNHKEAENVTDLSYFHVNYVKKKINEKLRREILIMKAFCVGQKVYGAESWVKGFSGYAIECLIIHFKTFEKTLKELSKNENKIIIDSNKWYKNANEVLIELNESKTKNPIVFVDPTFKERNVLSALSNETFSKFQNSAREFIKKPNKKYFERKEIDFEEMQDRAEKMKSQFIVINTETNKQEGDIAGAKLLKGSNFIADNIKKEFEIKYKEFDYDEKKGARLYLIVKPKNDLMIRGPPIEMEKHVLAFKKMHKDAYVKTGRLYSKLQGSKSARQFISDFTSKYNKQLKEMDIDKIWVE